jgi:hypothetical protein
MNGSKKLDNNASLSSAWSGFASSASRSLDFAYNLS